MDSRSLDKIKFAANNEVIRRTLIQYFIAKGYKDSFDRLLYPASLQDLPRAIPILASKIEVLPYAADIDAAQGRAVIGWNLFVLGNHRMFIGETYHNNLIDLAKQIRSGNIPVDNHNARKQTTPRKVIMFISRVLGSHKFGFVDLKPSTQPVIAPDEPFRVRGAMTGMPQQFFTRTP